MNSTPRVDGVAQDRLTPIEGMPPDLTRPTGLCPFLPRCRVSVDICRTEFPPMSERGSGHAAACFADLVAYQARVPA
jgi:oligopeptide transport system ATP-binding protein